MPRPLSQLIHTKVHEGADGPLVITMHDYNQYARDVADWGLAVAPGGRVLALESYKGVFMGHDVVGYTWFMGPNEAPSPIFFGDSLSEIERFLWDEVDRSKRETPRKAIIIGTGQGGIMAIATALAVPELVAGVITVNSFFPVVGGWEPPLAPLNGMPFLLVNPRQSDHPGVLSGQALVDQLTAWNGIVEVRTITDVSPATLQISDWVARVTGATATP